jgi:hypothetical protein
MIKRWVEDSSKIVITVIFMLQDFALEEYKSDMSDDTETTVAVICFLVEMTDDTKVSELRGIPDASESKYSRTTVISDANQGIAPFIVTTYIH